MARYGRLKLLKHPVHGLVLEATDRPVLEEVHPLGQDASRCSASASTPTPSSSTRASAARLKQVLLKLGWPAEDLAGYVDGEAHPIALHEDGWELRAYQRHAVAGFWHGGSGVVVLPCGAGKTIVGAAAMARRSATTLILVTNTVSARQWQRRAARRGPR